MKYIILIVALLSSSSSAIAQDVDHISDINFYADVTATAGIPQNRLKADFKLVALVEEFLANNATKADELSTIPYLSVKTAENGEFTLITWYVINEEKEYIHHGYIATREGKVHKLTPEPAAKPRDVAYERLDKDSWYGALYYNMMATTFEGKPAYLLFGFDGHEGFEHRKVVDVIRLVDGEPVFGAELFKEASEGNKRPTIYTRLLLEYSNDANVSVNYNEDLGLIKYDHLISRMGRKPGQGPTLVPDGSYVGYKWDGTYWNKVDKIFDQVSATPPMDGRKKKSNKTLFGGEKIKKASKKRE